jgi:NAD(P)-dependent dehydrogenase (short-subunit alcohol dehydrogenase family)
MNMARIPANPANGCAWVTGASSGIGAALVRRLVADGWKVAATARDKAALEKLAAEAPSAIVAAPADVADETAMAACAQFIEARLGPIGLIVANAGVYLPVNAPAIDPTLYKRTFDVNVLGVAHMLAPVLPVMAARRMGHIHIVSSATGFGGMPTASAYGASKAALINMAECLKIELDRHGVGVSLSTPGFVDTPAQTDNAFPKPFMVSADFAARRIVQGIRRGGFETTFPRRFTWILKALYALPKPVYLPLVRKQTGWAKPL